MAEFKREQTENFLGVVRKYMQVRGALSQKDLAELTEVGVSTMSRFLSQKTTELNAQLIAKIVAKLNIPLHEVIDFVDESFSERFIRLVKFYKEESGGEPPIPEGTAEAVSPPPKEETRTETKAKVSVAGGATRTIPFGMEGDKTETIKDKIAALTPRQKAYLTDFLNLDMEGKDLMVDLGNSLFRYFRQKGLES